MHRYTTLGKLGSGAFSVVWDARRIADGASVAIKKTRSCWVAQRELSTLKRLDGVANVVRLLDSWEADEFVVLVMPQCGQTLCEALESGLCLDVAELARQLLKALAACHAQGVIHNDLKSANVVVDPVVKNATLIDFNRASAPGVVLEQSYTTLWSRAPEHLMGFYAAAPAVDLWALGCILVETANRTAPFRGTDVVDQLFLIFQRFGTPSVDAWPALDTYPGWHQDFPKFRARPEPFMKDADMERLVRTLLSLIPERRGSAEALLDEARSNA